MVMKKTGKGALHKITTRVPWASLSLLKNGDNEMQIIESLHVEFQ
jgi:hypothetical protein